MEAIKTRRSIRAYRDQEVSRSDLLEVLEAGRLAPSAGNRQPWWFVVVTDPDLKQRLVPACHNQKFVGEAGVVIVGCADPKMKWHMVDTAIALDHMTLAAWEKGLGTCWIGAFEEGQVKQILGIPDEVKVVALLTLGWPAREGTFRGRKSLDEIVRWERW